MLGILTGPDGNGGGDDLREQMSCLVPWLSLVPLLGLLSTDGRVVGDDIWQHMSCLHGRQKAGAIAGYSRKH